MEYKNILFSNFEVISKENSLLLAQMKDIGVPLHLWPSDCSCWAGGFSECEEAKPRCCPKCWILLPEHLTNPPQETHTHTSGALFNMTPGGHLQYQLNNLGKWIHWWKQPLAISLVTKGHSNWRWNVKSGMKINVTMKKKRFKNIFWTRFTLVQNVTCRP